MKFRLIQTAIDPVSGLAVFDMDLVSGGNFSNPTNRPLIVYGNNIARGRYFGDVVSVLNQLDVHPLYIFGSQLADLIGLQVVAAGAAGSVIRLGLYSDNGAGYPGNLIFDSGSIDSTSIGLKTVAVPTLPLPEGLYWLSFLSGVATCNYRGDQNAVVGTGLPGLTAFAALSPLLRVAQAFGAFPNSFPIGAVETVASHAQIFLRLK